MANSDHDDQETIPKPGVIVIGRIATGAEVLDVSGSIKLTIDKAR